MTSMPFMKFLWNLFFRQHIMYGSLFAPSSRLLLTERTRASCLLLLPLSEAQFAQPTVVRGFSLLWSDAGFVTVPFTSRLKFLLHALSSGTRMQMRGRSHGKISSHNQSRSRKLEIVELSREGGSRFYCRWFLIPRQVIATSSQQQEGVVPIPRVNVTSGCGFFGQEQHYGKS